MKKLLQINPVLRTNTSTGRIMQEIGELAMDNGWTSYIAYSYGRDGMKPCKSQPVPVGCKWDVALHGITTRLFDAHGLASQAATRKLIKKIQEIKPDIIHIHNIHGYFLNYQTLFAFLAETDIPVVWTIHDCWLYTGHCYYYSFIRCNKWQTGCGDCPQKRKFPSSWFADRSHQNFIEKREAFTSVPVDRLTIVPVSEWIKREMKKSFFREYPFQVIHNGINTEVFKPSPTQEVKSRYGLDGKHILLGVAALWHPEKGVADFLQLASMIHEDEVIVMIGVDEKLKKSLPRNIIGIRRTENIRQMAELYSAADAFINPTWQDNYPTVNLEAIACGTPVITYRTGGSIEAVTPETGFIVEQGDVEGILKAVRIIRQHGKESYIAPCRSHALTHFRKEDRYADYIHLYNKLTAHTKSTAPAMKDITEQTETHR